MYHLPQYIQQLEQLSVEELNELLTKVTQTLQQRQPKTPRKWRDIWGSAPNLLDGEDAQEWVSKFRGG